MNGLLKKDLFLLKAGWKGYLALVVIYVFCSIVGSAGMLSALLFVTLLTIPVNAFTADEQTRWDGYAAVLPGGRRTMVRSKYQLLLLVAAGNLLLAAAVNLAIWLKDGGSYGELMLAAAVCVALGLAANCITFPILFQYGAAKGRVAILLCTGAAAALVVLGTFAWGLGDFVFRAVTPGGQVVLIILVLAILLGAPVASYRCSLGICMKKEY